MIFSINYRKPQNYEVIWPNSSSRGIFLTDFLDRAKFNFGLHQTEHQIYLIWMGKCALDRKADIKSFRTGHQKKLFSSSSYLAFSRKNFRFAFAMGLVGETNPVQWKTCSATLTLTDTAQVSKNWKIPFSPTCWACKKVMDNQKSRQCQNPRAKNFPRERERERNSRKREWILKDQDQKIKLSPFIHIVILDTINGMVSKDSLIFFRPPSKSQRLSELPKQKFYTANLCSRIKEAKRN